MCLGLAFLMRHGKAVPLQTEILLEKPPPGLARKSGLGCISPSETAVGAHLGKQTGLPHTLSKASISPVVSLKQLISPSEHQQQRLLGVQSMGWIQMRRSLWVQQTHFLVLANVSPEFANIWQMHFSLSFQKPKLSPS